MDYDRPLLEPRLFHCIERSNGAFRANEVDNFEQKDLVSDDVLILDSGAEIYIWIGESSNENEKKNALETAQVIAAKGIHSAGGISLIFHNISV